MSMQKLMEFQATLGVIMFGFLCLFMLTAASATPEITDMPKKIDVSSEALRKEAVDLMKAIVAEKPHGKTYNLLWEKLIRIMNIVRRVMKQIQELREKGLATVVINHLLGITEEDERRFEELLKEVEEWNAQGIFLPSSLFDVTGTLSTFQAPGTSYAHVHLCTPDAPSSVALQCDGRPSPLTISVTTVYKAPVTIYDTVTTVNEVVTSVVTTTHLVPIITEVMDVSSYHPRPTMLTQTDWVTKNVDVTSTTFLTDDLWVTEEVVRVETETSVKTVAVGYTASTPVITTSVYVQFLTTRTPVIVTESLYSTMTVTETVLERIPVTKTGIKEPVSVHSTIWETVSTDVLKTIAVTVTETETVHSCQNKIFDKFYKPWH